MAQAGWYPAPTEAGMLRYWNGESWTDYRQPLPVASGPVAVPVSAPVVQAQPEPALVAALQPGWHWGSANAQQEGGQQLAQQYLTQLQAQAKPAPQWVSNLVNEAVHLAGDQRNLGTGEAIAGGALAADGVVGFGRNRVGIGGSVKGMVMGLLFVAIGLFVLNLFGHQNTVGAGEVKTTGIVASQNWRDSGTDNTNSCYPSATFTVDGQGYTATSSNGTSPCPVSIGQSVEVIYTAASPANSGRVAVSGQTMLLLWIFPAAGLFAFLASLWTFIKRAGSIAGGIVLLRDGILRRNRR